MCLLFVHLVASLKEAWSVSHPFSVWSYFIFLFSLQPGLFGELRLCIRQQAGNEYSILSQFLLQGAHSEITCDASASLQEAQKRMKIKSPPRILALHLKRFKYIEQLGRYKKLSYRVVFPLELKLCNTTDDAPGSEAEYSLFAVVVHVGSGPNHGHYVSLVKSHNHWLFFDDENVEIIDESVVQTFFGSTQEYSNNTDHGYILFYESLEPKH